TCRDAAIEIIADFLDQTLAPDALERLQQHPRSCQPVSRVPLPARAPLAQHPEAAVYADGLSGDPGCVVRREKAYGARDVLRLTQTAQRVRLDERGLPRFAHCLPLGLGGGIRAEEARRDRVHADAVLAELARGLTREADQTRLGARIGLDAGEAVGATGAR